MMNEELLNKLNRALVHQGDLYSIQDVIDALNDGSMQSFTDGETWVITRISEFPRRKALDVMLVIGTLDGARAIEPQVINFAKEHGITLLTASGRIGWDKVKFDGWIPKNIEFYKEIA